MDLHVHTCLSPCGEENMTPRNIVGAAQETGLDVIGICDHNTCENVKAVRAAAKQRDIEVLGGIEVTSSEEVHFVVLFDKDEDLFRMQEIVYENLPGKNDPKIFGEQIIMSEEDEFKGENSRLLIGTTNLSSRQIAESAHLFHGLVIAAHVDREGFGIIGKLGFIPPDLPLDALEISPKITYGKARETLPISGYPVITSSDAHRPEDVGKSYTTFLIKDVNLAEMKKAFSGKEGRKVFLS
ncbi:MAG: PHP domain-containing protein [Candidatus Eremiobacteraeota bacterium]|nr:PHP domain-containing protein [Candidatus Eremiobacteraeota bacterium]